MLTGKNISLGSIVRFFLVLGTFLFAYWPKIYSHGSISPWRFELVFGIAALFFIIEIALRLIKKSINIDKENTKIFLTIGIFIFSIAFAAVIGYFFYDLPFNFMGVASIVKILLGIVIFFMILYEAREREIFYKMVSWALVMPNLLMIPLLFFPEIAERFGMLSEGYRFQGLTVNPGLFGLLAVIAFSFVCSFLFNTLRKKEPLHILVLHAFFLVGIGALVFWSQSRSYIIMLYFIPVITGFWYWGFIGMKLSKTIWSSVLAIILICGSFFFMPSLARNLLVNVRLFGAQESTDVIKLAKNPSGEQPTHSELLTRESLQTAKTIIAEDPRLTMWSYYLPLFPKYPLGWGANYQPKFAFPWHYNSSVSFLPPIFIFNVWAIGGVVALISLILLSWEALIQFRRQLTDRANTLTPYAAGTATAFSMFWITSVFNGFPIEYLCFWIILALLLSDINPKPLPPDYGTYAR